MFSLPTEDFASQILFLFFLLLGFPQITQIEKASAGRTVFQMTANCLRIAGKYIFGFAMPNNDSLLNYPFLYWI